ncbi:MAG: hypothetical protein ACRYGG_00215 [Janthinobacterium lividum]
MIQRHAIPGLDDARDLMQVLDHARREKLNPGQRRQEALQNATETAGSVMRVLGVVAVVLVPWVVGGVVLLRWALS